MEVIRRRASFVVMHFSRLNRICQRKPAPIRESDAGLSTESADTATAGIAQAAEHFSIEEIAGTAGKSLVNCSRRFSNDQVQQFEIGTRCFKYRGFARYEKNAGAFLGRMRLISEVNDALGRSLHDVNQVVIIAGLKVPLFSREDGLLVYRQVLRTAQFGAAQRFLDSCLDGLRFCRI